MARSHHLKIPVSSVDRSRHFYRHLGYESSASWQGNALHLRDKGGFDLALIPGTPNPKGVRFGVRLKDLNQLKLIKVALQSDGVRVFDEKETKSTARFGCRDPDGYQVEVSWP